MVPGLVVHRDAGLISRKVDLARARLPPYIRDRPFPSRLDDDIRGLGTLRCGLPGAGRE